MTTRKYIYTLKYIKIFNCTFIIVNGLVTLNSHTHTHTLITIIILLMPQQYFFLFGNETHNNFLLYINS